MFAFGEVLVFDVTFGRRHRSTCMGGLIKLAHRQEARTLVTKGGFQ
jgi:hypothetical protein